MSFVSIISSFARSLLHRRAVRPLRELEEHLLADMGLTRGDVHRSLAQSIFVDPSRALKDACCHWMASSAGSGKAGGPALRY